MERVSMEQLINTSYIKYGRMCSIVEQAFVGSTADDVNIYVDLYSILKPLYDKSELYSITDYSLVTSCVINLCAHYRELFMSRYKVRTKIYLIYSDNCHYINKQFYPEYNHGHDAMVHAKKQVTNMIQQNIELLSTLCPYLPDIFFINGTFETGVYMYDLICRNELTNPTAPHIILSKDKYLYQLVPTRNNIIYLRPKKFKGEDISYYLDKSNVMEYIMSERGIKYRPKTWVSPELITLLMTMTSVQERFIKILMDYTSALKSIEKAIQSHTMLNGYSSNIDLSYTALYSEKMKIGDTTFAHRFKAIDLVFQHSVFITTPEAKNVDSCLVNLYDPETVKDINNKYFINNPLDLNRL